MLNKIKEYIENAEHGFYFKFNISLYGIFICFHFLNIKFIEIDIPLPFYWIIEKLQKHQFSIFYKEYNSPFTTKYDKKYDYRRRYIEVQSDWCADLTTGVEISIPLQLQDHMDRSINISFLGFWLILSSHHKFHVLPKVKRFPTIEEAKEYEQVWYDEMIKQYTGENWSNRVNFNDKEDYAKRRKAWDKADKYWQSIKK